MESFAFSNFLPFQKKGWLSSTRHEVYDEMEQYFRHYLKSNKGVQNQFK